MQSEFRTSKDIYQKILRKLKIEQHRILNIPGQALQRNELLKICKEASQEFDPAVGANVKMALDFAVLASNYTITDLIEYIRVTLEDPFDAQFYKTEDEDAFDAKFGTKTSLIYEQFALPDKISIDRFKNSGRYIPTPINTMKVALEGAGRYLDYREFFFIDAGAGLGRNLLLASEYPFKKIIGIEISEFLTAQAKSNIQHYGTSDTGCKDVEATCADALKYSFPDHDVFIYMWEPFDEQVFEIFLSNLIAHISKLGNRIFFAILGQKYSRSKALSSFKYLGALPTPGLIDGFAKDYLTVNFYANYSIS